MQKIDLTSDDHQCFACGLENLHGLQLVWDVEGQTMTTHFTAEQKYQGWSGIVHGGILATLLDESMTRLAVVLYGGAVTAEMTVRYKIPARIGQVFYVRGEVVKESSRLIEMKAYIHEKDASGALVAHATGKIARRLSVS